MTSYAIRIHANGGPEVLKFDEVEIGAPVKSQVLIHNTAIGVNYADIYEREGDHGGPHSTKPFPITMGHMAAGFIAAVGPDTDGPAVGTRVGYVGGNTYATHTIIAADRLVVLPDAVSDEVAGAYLLRGLTAEYLLRRLFPVGPGVTALVHAAAGGMGLMLGQWGTKLGARMIGTVSSAEKMEVALTFGYDTVINYSSEDFALRIMELTKGRGVDVVYDGIGKAAFRKSLDCVRPRGMVVSYGTSSGNVGAFDLQLLHSKSIVVTRPTLRSFIADPNELSEAAAALFDALGSGEIKTPIGGTMPLEEAAEAQRRLESRRLTAPIVLIP
jgi:NADPH2:quinone reductase